MRLKRPSKRFIFIVTGIVGILIVISGEFLLHWQRSVLSFSTNPYGKVSSSYDSQLLPNRISIENVGIDLDIEEGKIVGGIWQISGTTATHLNNSEVPGRSGNIVIYGHNLMSIFGKLVNIKKGDIVVISTRNGKGYQYKVTDILEVDPTDIGVVAPTNREELTVYTCTGFLDSKRLVVKALPIR